MDWRREIAISDEALDEFNARLDWHAPTHLPDGRLLGRINPGKRETIAPIPERRIALLNARRPLAGRKVLEVGCFEGIHTLGLLSCGADVTAIDVRPENVLKTLARVSLHGGATRVHLLDCESMDASFGRFDLVFHFGVLYHLVDPVRHLAVLGRLSDTLYLDTHVAPRDAALESEEIDGATYRHLRVVESGWKAPFAGASAFAKHLTLDSLHRALDAAGFRHRRLIQARPERNGPRVLIFASRTDEGGDWTEADPEAAFRPPN